MINIKDDINFELSLKFRGGSDVVCVYVYIRNSYNIYVYLLLNSDENNY